MRVPDPSSQWWGSELEEINQRMKELERSLSSLKEMILYEKQYIPEAMKLKAAVKRQKEEVLYMQTHLPSRLPGSVKLEEVVINKENIREENVIPHKDPTPQQKKTKKIKVASIPYVTKDEFELVPKYMKGRITQEKVNAAVDEIQVVLEAKYKLLACNYIKLNGEPLKKFKAYKEEETADTKGLFYFSESIDMKVMSHLKSDASGKAIISVLRAVNRIRDLGGANRRYAVCC